MITMAFHTAPPIEPSYPSPTLSHDYLMLGRDESSLPSLPLPSNTLHRALGSAHHADGIMQMLLNGVSLTLGEGESRSFGRAHYTGPDPENVSRCSGPNSSCPAHTLLQSSKGALKPLSLP